MKLKLGILTVSDRSSRGKRDDASGPMLKKIVEEQGWEVSAYEIIPDDIAVIRQKLIDLAGTGLNLLLTTGGTGFSPRDVTPEATLEVLDKQIPGFGELIRMENCKKTKLAVLSRGVSGIMRGTIVINLPGSTKGAAESLEVLLPVIPHGVKVLIKEIDDCKDDEEYRLNI